MGPTDPRAPTYSSSTSAPSGLANVYYPASNRRPDAFSVYGAAREDAGNSIFVRRFSSKSGTKVYGDCKIAFYTDAPKFSIMAAATANFRVRIDGRLYSPDTVDYIASGTGFHTFDFTTSGGRKTRLVVVDNNRNHISFAGVAVSNLDQVWAPDGLDKLSVVTISDSIFAGSSYGPYAYSVPQLLSTKLGWSDVWNFSTGGTGYIETNTAGGGPFYTFGQRVTEAQNVVNPDIWIFAGSVNDKNNTAADVQAAALSAFQAVRAVSSVPIIVIGVWSIDITSATLNALQIETAVQAAVTQFNDPHTFFIPVATDVNGPWVSHPNNNSAFVTSSNIAMATANDGTHPADIGSMYFADRITRAIKHHVLPNLK